MANQIVWCDIPVLDLDRAVKFYSAVLGQLVKKQEFPGMTIGILPHDDGEVGGCLFTSAEEKPSDKGMLIYLNASGRLARSRRWPPTAARSSRRNIPSGRLVFARSSSTVKAIELRCIRISLRIVVEAGDDQLDGQ